MAEKFRLAGEAHFIDEPVLLAEGFDAYLRWLEAGESGASDGLVPWSAYWAVVNGGLVGVSSLRHELSPWMTEFGGDIGYRVRLKARRRGFGAEILRLTLDAARERGIDPALIGCEPDNSGSMGVIARNGCQFDRETVREDGVRLSRYWVSARRA